MTTAATLDVVIVSFNTAADLESCLSSLLAHPPGGLREVHVVDNASTDGSATMVARRFPEVRLRVLDRNVGFAAANNLVLRESKADLVLLLNSDTVVRPGALDELVARHRATGAVASGPKLIDASGRPEISFGPMLTPWHEARQAWRVRRAGRHGLWARRATARLVAHERPVDWVSGACLLVDRRAAIAAGLLDERYFMYEEDVDFCAALRARGGRVVYVPSAAIEHRRGRSSAAAGQAPSRHYDRSHVAFYEKHLPAWAPWLRRWLRLRGRAIR